MNINLYLARLDSICREHRMIKLKSHGFQSHRVSKHKALFFVDPLCHQKPSWWQQAKPAILVLSECLKQLIWFNIRDKQLYSELPPDV